MVYLVLIYALIYTLGEFVSRRIGLPHSVTFAGLAVFLAAALILYRRRYGLGACRPGAEAVARGCVAAALAGRRSGAGRLRPQRRRGRVFRLRDVRRVRHGGGAGFPRVSVGTYAAAAAADGGRAQRGRVRRVPRRQSHRRRTGRRRHTGGVRRLHGFALCGTVAYYRSIVPALGIHALINLFGGLFPADDLRGAGLLVSGFCAACSVLAGLWMLRAEENGKHETVH